MIIQRITTGTVTQVFDTITKTFVSQEFTPIYSSHTVNELGEAVYSYALPAISFGNNAAEILRLRDHVKLLRESLVGLLESDANISGATDAELLDASKSTEDPEVPKMALSILIARRTLSQTQL